MVVRKAQLTEVLVFLNLVFVDAFELAAARNLTLKTWIEGCLFSFSDFSDSLEE